MLASNVLVTMANKCWGTTTENRNTYKTHTLRIETCTQLGHVRNMLILN